MFALWRAAVPSRAIALEMQHLNEMEWPEPKAPRSAARKSGRLASRVERGISRNCYGIGGKAGKVLPIRHPRGIDSFNMHAVEGDGRRRDRRMMRSGKAEDAMGVAGMIGIAGRQLRRLLGIVQTKLESRRVIADICRKGEAAKCDQQALRGDRIGDDDADQRSQEPLGLDAQSEYATHANGTIDPAAAALISLRQSRLYTTLSRQNARSAGAINAWCGSEATPPHHKIVGRHQ
jgi:hypothetical protein